MDDHQDSLLQLLRVQTQRRPGGGADQEDTGLETELEVGSPGEFTVWVDDTKIAEKLAGRFPEPRDVVAAVRTATSH